jgi:SanA protein
MTKLPIHHIPKKIAVLFLTVFILCLSLPFLLYFSLTRSLTFLNSNQIDQLQPSYAALILGAGIYSDGTPSDILKDRIDIGVQLYKAGKVKKLIMSGDNRVSHHNEPEVMKNVAIGLGVPETDIQPDYAGRRTYDSCWRAKNIFSQDQIIIVTQSFHMPRALFLCSQLGINSQGITADTERYSGWDWNYWKIRDMLSFSKSLIDLYFFHPGLVKGEKIGI